MEPRPFGKKAAVLAAFCFVAGCAGYSGRGLEPGRSGLAEVEERMGSPALRWQEPDGSQVLAYPRGPGGYHTYMVRMAPGGQLAGIENVLDERHFARIRQGMGQDEVLRVLGPPVAAWTVYFKARDELAWEWRYCNDWNAPTRFNVLFDGASGKVRSTLSMTEAQRFGDGSTDGAGREWCSR